MNFTQFSRRMERAKALGSKPGLSRIRKLLSELRLPDEEMHILHVTGTNGKGSTSAAIAGGLLACGYAVGRFSSPEIFSPLERILVGEKPVSEGDICLAAQEVFPAADRMEDSPTEYELYMALCLVCFRNAGVTHGVIEVCMGGARDVTHVFSHTEVCVFTPISADHTKWLGSTPEEIAKEKAGILTPGCIAVSGAQTSGVQRVLEEACKNAGAKLTFINRADIVPLTLTPDFTEISYKGCRAGLGMGGIFQTENLSLAMEALMQWARLIPIPLDRAFAALKEVHIPGRFSHVAQNPDIYFDAGHNPAGISALCACIDTFFADRPLIAVMAMYADKDYKTCIGMVAKRAAVFIAAESDSPRALPAGETAVCARTACPDVRIIKNAGKALLEAKRICPENGAVLLCGSFGHLAQGYRALD